MGNLLDCGTTDRDRETVKDVWSGTARRPVKVPLNVPVLFFLLVFLLSQ